MVIMMIESDNCAMHQKTASSIFSFQPKPLGLKERYHNMIWDQFISIANAMIKPQGILWNTKNNKQSNLCLNSEKGTWLAKGGLGFSTTYLAFMCQIETQLAVVQKP